MPIEPAFRKFLVVVMGSSSSGVTAFINHISELPPKTVPDPNPSDTLKPLDYGRLTLNPANVVYLYGLSEENPQSAWSFLFDRDDFVGVIALVDSTRPDRFSIVKTMVDNTEDKIPFLIAVNKQDLQHAWEPNAIRIAMSIRNAIPVVKCSAKTGQGVREAVLMIVNMLQQPDEWNTDRIDVVEMYDNQ